MAMLKGNYLITTLIKCCILSQNIEGPPGNISYNKMIHKMLIYVKIDPWVPLTTGTPAVWVLFILRHNVSWSFHKIQFPTSNFNFDFRVLLLQTCCL